MRLDPTQLARTALVPAETSTSGPGQVPDALRRNIASFFLDVVHLREQVKAATTGYAELAAAVQAYADEIDDYGHAMALEPGTGIRAAFDLLLDIANEIQDATGWEARPVNVVVACDPLFSWPKTGWPLETCSSQLELEP